MISSAPPAHRHSPLQRALSPVVSACNSTPGTVGTVVLRAAKNVKGIQVIPAIVAEARTVPGFAPTVQRSLKKWLNSARVLQDRTGASDGRSDPRVASRSPYTLTRLGEALTNRSRPEDHNRGTARCHGRRCGISRRLRACCA